MPVNITFRTQLLGGVAEFCGTSRIPLLAQAINLVELIVLLAKYKEEGRALFPEVYLTTDISALCAMLPQGERIDLGVTTRDAAGLGRAIKKTAPLAIAGWLVFLQDRDNDLSYGLFRGPSNPTSVLADDVILHRENLVPVTKVFQVAEDCVQVLSCYGDHHYVFLNHRKDDSPPPLAPLRDLVECICLRVSDDLKEPVQSFLTRTVYGALRVSHGCLIAVTNRKAPPSSLFDDGIGLGDPIDFPTLVKHAKSDPILSSKLISASALLEGMLDSDGIVLFDDRARILGFNYFVRAKAASKEAGGARRRAFATLEKNLGKGLVAAFMQSQDGWSELRKVTT